MTTQSITTTNPSEHHLDAGTLEKLVTAGDLSGLTPTQRVQYYRARCEAAGLDYRTQPFRYMTTDGKLSLYAEKSCTDQLGKIHGVTYRVVSKGVEAGTDCYVVEMEAKDAKGRLCPDLGVVSIKGLGGTNLANAMMKAITKARRRATLSLCGLGMLDESELDGVPAARTIDVDPGSGEVEVPDFHSRIVSATTVGALDAIKAAIIKTPGIPSDEIRALQAQWQARHAELSGPVPTKPITPDEVSL